MNRTNDLQQEREVESESLDLSERIRINQVKLRTLLKRTPSSSSEKFEEDSKEEDSELPFYSGPLRLSVYRSPSVDPKPYDAWSSAVRLRPLSETFVLPGNILSSDLSSSSDEEVTDPVPESPLNLSDSDSMASGQSSPAIIGRRRKFLGITSSSNRMKSPKQVRPTSLYDAAKPRPPSKSNDLSFGGKISRLIGFRSRKMSKENTEDVVTIDSSDEPFSPERLTDSWTNIVNSSPHQAVPERLQPHPPLRDTVSAPSMRPRKKRMAPKPPTTALKLSNAVKTENEDNKPAPGQGQSDTSVETTPIHDDQSERISKDSVQCNTHDQSNNRNPDKPPESSELSIKSMPNVSETDSVAITIDTCSISTPLCTTAHEKEVSDSDRPLESQDSMIDSTSNDTEATPMIRETTSPVNPDNQSPVEKTTSGSESDPQETRNQEKCQLQDEITTTSFCAKNADENECKRGESGSKVEIDGESTPHVPTPATNEKHSNSKVNNATPLCRNNEEAIPASSEQHDVIQTKHAEDSKSSEDELLLLRHNESKKDKKRRVRKAKRRDSAENASSGYSSPGSADENCPLSPEPVTSPSALTIPSPTSSYYSTSLSASSSRVSDVSRELTLTTSPNVTLNDDTLCSLTRDGTAKPEVDPEISKERDMVCDVNMNTVTAGGRHEASTEAENRELCENISENKELKEDLLHNSPEMKCKTRNGIQENEEQISAEPGTPELPKQRSVSMVDVSDPVQVPEQPERPVTMREKKVTRSRAKSEFIPYHGEREAWQKQMNRVTICMVERPGDSSRITKNHQSTGIFKAPLGKGPSKKKSLAAQKSRAFALRANSARPNRHSYAGKENYIDEEFLTSPEVPSSNLASHFVSTQNISSYYDGNSQRIVTSQEILNSKRQEFFNAYRYTGIGRGQQQFGGSVQQLPVSSAEFARISIYNDDTIPEVNEIDAPMKDRSRDIEENVTPVVAVDVHSKPSQSPVLRESGSVNTGISRQVSSSSSDSSGRNTSSVFTGSAWSLSTDMTSQQTVRSRKPSLRRRLQGAFSFQNIRRAISTEKLSEDEKRRSMSHYYLNGSGTSDVNGRADDVIGRTCATLPASHKRDHDVTNDPPKIRKAPSITSLIATVRMRKRRSRMQKDNWNRYTIADPGNFPNFDDVTDSKRSTLRPMSLILPSSSSRKSPKDVGNPEFFRPIGKVLQMNPLEGTLLVEMVKPSSGPFGFYIARKKEAGDSGSVFISRLSDSYPDKMFAGLMRTGDEITEVNGTKVAGLTLDQVYDLILDSEKTLLKLKPSQVHVV